MGQTEKSPIIEISELTKSFKGVKALEGVNLKIYPGEFVILVGPSGAGKSTLISLLIREEMPDGGKIKIAGRDITRLSLVDLPYFRRNVGIVFQDYKLLETKTVFENVAYALEVADVEEQEVRAKVPKILEAVNLRDKANAYPKQLSGGEAQRVSIARSLVHSPKILIADEPTGNLDPEASQEVADILEKINCQGTVVILATHNRDLVDRMRKRVVLLKRGRVVSDQMQGRYTC